MMVDLVYQNDWILPTLEEQQHLLIEMDVLCSSEQPLDKTLAELEKDFLGDKIKLDMRLIAPTHTRLHTQASMFAPLGLAGPVNTNSRYLD
jgi:hypothetical protein